MLILSKDSKYVKKVNEDYWTYVLIGDSQVVRWKLDKIKSKTNVY